MDSYEKYKTVHHPLEDPFVEILCGDSDKVTIVEVRVSTHSVVGKVVGFAMRKLKDPTTDVIVLIGQDKASQIARKCAESLQRKFGDLHQCNGSGYKVHEDIWVGKDVALELDSLSVKRHIPVTFILLAKELPEKLKSHPYRVQISKTKQKDKNCIKKNSS